MTHVIRRGYLHVEVQGSESDALALQRTLPELCREWLEPALERVLERTSPPSGHLCLERLEVDLGTLHGEQLEHDLAQAVEQELERALREQMARAGFGPGSPSGAAEYKSKERRLLDVFTHFLKSGSLPWSFRLPAGETLEQVLLKSWQNEGAARMEQMAKILLPGVLAVPTARTRLVRQFSPPFLLALFSFFSPESARYLSALLGELRQGASPGSGMSEMERSLWELVFAEVPAGRAKTPAELAEAVRCGAPLPSNVIPFPGRGRVREGETPCPGEHPEAGEGIYVDNAGVVLLHPFLPQLFRALQIAEEERLLQPERALSLLHFLASGDPAAPEYELVLPKILCGVPLLQPVHPAPPVTAAEQEEAAALLQAVIGHWSALRNTSPDTLRGSFLMRPGKVSLREDDWLLQVETQTCDILLDQLPWGVSPVKLPWMERMLWVEWR